MTSPGDLPLWAAWVVVVLALLGAGVSLLGAMGLTMLKQFYQRGHAVTLGATVGMASIVLSAVVFWTIFNGYLSMKYVLIAIFFTVTTPVMLILLARAAAYRDRIEGSEDVPPE